MNEQDLSYAMRTVPRYTSYPTAPHFHEGVTGDTYARWLDKLGPADTLSLYLHVPYCREICHYCGCHTKATRQDTPLAAYARTLGQEIELAGQHLKAAGPVRHIHWGGGTPSLLSEASFLDLAGLLRVLFRFAPDLEHAIELDPRNVTRSLAETLAEIGVNRASLGVQDFDPGVQVAIGRIQSYEVVASAARHLREAGITALNFDLMYGLPGQSARTIRDTVSKTVELRPGRVALFGYAHVPWMRKHQRLIDEKRLPNAQDRLAMADIAREDLISAGYVPIGLDHFALPDDLMAIALQDGSLKRNFQGYTTDQGDQLIGLGVSSIGRLDQGYVQNMPDVGNWRRSVEAGQLPISKGLELTRDDLVRGRIIEQLMTDYRCDLAQACGQFGLDVATLNGSLADLEDLRRDGLVNVGSGRAGQTEICVTERGRPYVRLVAAAFDAYLAESLSSGKAKHSVAI
ncbi:oxygen-independent coproporphyrinogen III oxidase [Roseibium aquae]|uniref:Coproporphyrinogen-III oxidase n=1 Tax=Roseibium aquae TaxID=1323746 RepID=A0A916TK87_9HYPH|nr:oxygen-independent coproporphyrinogen III oxidase [Roseibium aquae]GGB48807.1 oxygen-independent coproporphyrinogen III oxidase [Roseibium aquae]